MAHCQQDLQIQTRRLPHPAIVAVILAEVIEAEAAAGETMTVGAEAEEVVSMMTGTVLASGAALTTAVGGVENEMTAIEETGTPRIRTVCFTENHALSVSCCRNELEMSPCRGLNKSLGNLRFRQRKTCLRLLSRHRPLRLDQSPVDKLQTRTFNH
jgi:hypothetical protein